MWGFILRAVLVLCVTGAGVFSWHSADAPTGTREQPGGRSLASIQEEDFDRELFRLDLCYGVRVEAAGASDGRRRACKVVAARKVSRILENAGAFLPDPVVFECSDDGVGTVERRGEGGRLVLRPNREHEALELFEQNYLSKKQDLPESRKEEIRMGCLRIVDCHRAMRWKTFDTKMVLGCLWERDQLKRRIILDQYSNLLFKHKSTQISYVGSLLQDL